MNDSAYLAALKLLSGRELSERQLCQRLARRGHDQAAIQAAVSRLKEDRSLDDARAALSIARTESTIRKRGRLRIRQRLESLGIATEVARRAIDEALAEIDEDAVLVGALQSRLRGRSTIADEREFSRLYRFLVGQGFEADRVLALLRTLKYEE